MAGERGWALRRGRYSEQGRIYLLTLVTRERRPLFESLYAARTLVNVLRGSDEYGRSKTLAYVVMPDHLHWLMELGGERPLSMIVGTVKSLSTRGLGGGHLWQKGFHDRAIRREEDLAVVARYIVANPLRAGLVERIGDYPHWDASWL